MSEPGFNGLMGFQDFKIQLIMKIPKIMVQTTDGKLKKHEIRRINA